MMKKCQGVAAAVFTAAVVNGLAFAEGVDVCADAVETPAGVYSFDLTGATVDGNSSCGLNAASPDVWFKHTATVAGNMAVSTCGGATFDTILSAFDGCGGPQIACLDDGCGLQSTLSFPVSVGQTVYIRLCGYNGQVGAGTVTITAPTPPLPGTVFESGDAGDIASTAFVPSGSGSIPAIFGNIESGTDADLFKIRISEPANFSASLDNADTTGDTQIWLFNDTGVGVSMNDDGATSANIRASQLTSVNTASLAPGDFYLGVTRYNLDPLDASGGALWNACAVGFECEDPPSGPGAANPVASWTGNSGTGGYKVVLTGVSYPGGPACAADLDNGSGTGVPDNAVTIDDLLYFLGQFEAGSLGADLDNGTGTGTTDGAVTIDDLLYFLVRFEAGC